MDNNFNRIDFTIGKDQSLGYAMRHGGKDVIAYKRNKRYESFIYLDDLIQMFENIEPPELIDLPTK